MAEFLSSMYAGEVGLKQVETERSERTILLVEDEVLIAMAETRDLERMGYAVVSAYSGDQAIRAVTDRSEIDLVLMDIDLGAGPDGTEVARAILAIRDLPILFLSSHSEPDIVERTEEVTSYGYVVKNAGPTVLKASIRMAYRLFESHRRERDLAETADRYLNVVAEIVLVLDTKGDILRLNESGHRLLGYRNGELIGRNWLETCLPDWERQAVNAVFHRRLDPAATDTERHENDVITRTGRIRRILWYNTILTGDDGETIGILSSGEDITDRAELEATLRGERANLQRLSRLQELLIEIASGFSPSEGSISDALAVLGAGIGADRAYVFTYDFENGVAVNTYEWCADEIAPQIEELQALPLSAIDEAIALHRSGRTHYVADVSALPPGRMRTILEPQGIRSLLTVPILTDDLCVGSVGFDFVSAHHDFSEHEQGILTVFARSLANRYASGV